MTDQEKEKLAALDRLLGICDEAVELIKSLNDPSLSAYCLAAFEGRGPWLGTFERDYIQEARDALHEQLLEETDGGDRHGDD